MKPLSALISDPAERNLLAGLRQACEVGNWLYAESLLQEWRGQESALVPLGDAWIAVARHQLSEAEIFLRQALNQAPEWGEIWLLLARVCQQQGKRLSAIQALGEVLNLDPLHPPALSLLIRLLQEVGDLDALLALFTLLLNPQLQEEAAWKRLSPLDQNEIKRLLPQWHALGLVHSFNRDGNRLWLKQAATQWEQRWLAPYPAARSWPHRWDEEDALNVLFVSNEWHAPAVRQGYLPLIQGLDRHRFRLFAAVDQAGEHLLGSIFDGQWACADWDAWQWYREVQAHKIAIIVDLSGWLNPQRIPALALKAAPVLLAAGSNPPFEMGLSIYDGFWGDERLNPAKEHSERGSYFYWHAPHSRAPEHSEEHQNLRMGSVASLNKLSSETLRLWIAVMQNHPEAQFWHKSEAWSDPELQTRFRQQWQGLGGDPTQLYFEDNRRETGYLRFLASLDLVLDSTPYGGALTSCEALWVGTPVLSLRGGLRLGDSLLDPLGIPELLAHDEADYVAKAQSILADQMRLKKWQHHLPQALLASPVCNKQAQIQALETLMQTAWQKFSA